MPEREFLMKKLMAERFALWEIVLFLDTHPNDEKALEAFNKYRESFFAVKKEYEDKFGMLTPFSDNKSNNKWTWIDSPWPWE